MKYYVIINGESSLDIQGLAIESLPAISKPLMRSKREEIDGRNGDIITQLGYSAYDKTLKIGLWGDYDIDEVITFFNQEGTITFSNEPDKYYNFTILNRIDFINQLEAFRKATITIHCQPFKYKEEETEELEIITKEVSGTDISVNDSYSGTMDIVLNGNTYQKKLTGKNILDDTQWIQNRVVNGTSGEITYSQNNSASEQYMEVQPNTTYTFSSELSCRSLRVGTYKSDKSFIERKSSSANVSTWTFTTDANTYYLRWNINYNDTTITQEVIDSLKLQINSGNERGTYENYCGGTPSPNPSYPQDINVVSGNNNVVVCGKNLFDKDNANVINGFLSDNGTLVSDNVWKTLYIQCKPNTTYTIQKIEGKAFRVADFENVPAISSSYISRTRNDTATSITMTTANNGNYLAVSYYRETDTLTPQQVLDSIQIEYGNQATTYEAYNGTTYPINLGSIELCKIGTYQDYFYKDSGKWYLHKEIEKVVLNGSEEWAYTNNIFYISTITDYKRVIENICVSNYYSTQNNVSTTADVLDNHITFRVDTAYTSNRLYLKNSSITSASNLQTWLSTHNTIINYVLATPTNTEITDSTLLSQLEAIKSANSYYGTTNINQVNNDLPFILDVSYLSGTNEITITNHGNYYSKPTLTLTGTGNINIYLNDNQIFQVALGTNETIIIDTDKMEAYYESTLKNRQVIGDYNSFKLLSGENTIRISGTFSKLQVDNYSRWI